MIRITAKRDGFRRCGIVHSKQPTEYADDRFTAKELKALKAEPMLKVETVEAKKQTPAPTPSAEPAAKEKAEPKAQEKAEPKAQEKAEPEAANPAAKSKLGKKK